jgi:16S rRNA (cytidine1402-2'-O)-methyltransferase
VAGLVAERFAFIGFLPSQAKARRECLATITAWPVALVFYEAPHRIVATMGELAGALDPRRAVTVAREITKTFEAIATMPLGEATRWLVGDANRTRGEFVLIVDAPLPSDVESASPEAVRVLARLLDELPPARASRVAADLTGVGRDLLYRRALELTRK